MSSGDGGESKESLPGSKSSDHAPTKGSDSDSPVDTYVLSDSSSDEDKNDELRKATAKSLLDFSSPNFSPYLALRCSSLDSVPVAEGAKTYLNLQKYKKAVKCFSKSPRKDVSPLKKMTVDLLKQKVPPKKPEDQKPSTSLYSLTQSQTQNFPIPGRRFLPHQLPVFRPRREHPNTLTLMETAEGPLQALKRVMTEKTRVKIWTRNEKGFRGYLTGFVEAFDKHWNIALRDVDEQFVRKRVVKFPIMGDAISIPEKDSDKLEGKETLFGKSNKDDDEYDEILKKKGEAISSIFIRLKNYLRQNEGRRRGIDNSTLAPKNNLRSSKRTSTSGTTPSVVTTKSKTIYVGDMDPLNICRTGLERLSLCDSTAVDIHQEKEKQLKSTTSVTAPTPRRASTRTKRASGERPDIIECHQRVKGLDSSSAEPSSSSSSLSSTSCAASSSVPTIHHQIQPLHHHSISRTALKRKSLTVFKKAHEDSFGFMVVAHTKKYELVERHVGQLLLMGNDIVFIETSGVDKL